MVPVFVSPRNRVAQLYPQALDSLFVDSYDSQSYGGGILNRLHTGLTPLKHTQTTVQQPPPPQQEDRITKLSFGSNLPCIPNISSENWKEKTLGTLV
jgi:hypothetical protein